MSQQHCHFDASKSLTALEQDSTSQSKWLVAALVPGVGRHPPEEARCPGGDAAQALASLAQ
jgi:hypothetical protein